MKASSRCQYWTTCRMKSWISLWHTTKTAVVAATKSQWPTKTPETWVGGTVRNLPTHLNRSCAAMWQDRFSSGWACGRAVTRSQSRDSSW